MTGMFSSVVCVDCLDTSETVCMTRTAMSSAFVHRYFSHSQHMSAMKRCGFSVWIKCGTAVRILTVLWWKIWCSNSIDEDSNQDLNPFIMKWPFFYCTVRLVFRFIQHPGLGTLHPFTIFWHHCRQLLLDGISPFLLWHKTQIKSSF
jgi:hypothetical protein